jgi:hypothetical protein
MIPLVFLIMRCLLIASFFVGGIDFLPVVFERLPGDTSPLVFVGLGLLWWLSAYIGWVCLGRVESEMK